MGRLPGVCWLSWSQDGVVPQVWALRSWHHEILKLQEELALLCFGLVGVLEQPETRRAQEGTRLLLALHIPVREDGLGLLTASHRGRRLLQSQETELKGL